MWFLAFPRLMGLALVFGPLFIADVRHTMFVESPAVGVGACIGAVLGVLSFIYNRRLEGE